MCTIAARRDALTALCRVLDPSCHTSNHALRDVTGFLALTHHYYIAELNILVPAFWALLLVEVAVAGKRPALGDIAKELGPGWMPPAWDFGSELDSQQLWVSRRCHNCRSQDCRTGANKLVRDRTIEPDQRWFWWLLSDRLRTCAVAFPWT